MKLRHCLKKKEISQRISEDRGKRNVTISTRNERAKNSRELSRDSQMKRDNVPRTYLPQAQKYLRIFVPTKCITLHTKYLRRL